MRYLRAVEHVIFGESYLGYLSLMLVLPMLVFAMFRRFLPLRWALALALIFAATPVGVLFGSSLVLYVKWAARGFGDPAAYALFLSPASCCCSGRPDSGPRDRFASACGAGLCFALAAVRAAEHRARGRHPARRRRSGGALAAPIPPPCRHVPRLPAGARHGAAQLGLRRGVRAVHLDRDHHGTLVMPPSAYLAALSELLRLDFAGRACRARGEQIGAWLAGPSELLVMAPLT